MIERFFKDLATVQQHRQAATVGPYLDGLVEYLAEGGYSRQTVRRYIYACEEFGRFLAERGIGLQSADATRVEKFLHEAANEGAWRRIPLNPLSAINVRRPAVALLLTRLREKGIVVDGEQAVASVEPRQPDVLAEYLAFLRQHRGIQEVTIRQHQLHVGRFLTYLDGGVQAIHQLTTLQLDGFIVECGRWMSRRSLCRVSAALCGFLRYLHLSGQLDRDLSPQIARPRVYALETVPRALAWTDVIKLLAAPDRSTVRGRRDYAILLLLVVYGLRGGEVAALTLDDIDWRRNQLRIPHSKSGHPSWYPLHPEVGEAIADYLRRGRPATSCQQIFLTLYAPVRPFSRSSAVSNIVERHLRRAGIEAPHWGSHTLRHSRAVHLLQHGFSLEAIGELLGHRRQQSSFIYAKAALDDLRSVALEVTEVLP
jgi:integrase/recombinase XerD